MLLDTFKPLVTLMTLPAEYPETGTVVTLQLDGLPAAQLTAVRCVQYVCHECIDTPVTLSDLFASSASNSML